MHKAVDKYFDGDMSGTSVFRRLEWMTEEKVSGARTRINLPSQGQDHANHWKALVEVGNIH